MPDHKFRYTDLEVLENNPPTGKFHLLIVGTFNADNTNNKAAWFYGRQENEFWCLLPRMMNDPTLHSVDRNETAEQLTGLWKQYCAERKIIIVDLFKAVHNNLLTHADKELENIIEGEYLAFDFRKAFAQAEFDAVMFTWKGMNNNRLSVLKQQYIDFFTASGSIVMHMLTPSLAYSKPRSFKLAQWRSEYQSLNLQTR